MDMTEEQKKKMIELLKEMRVELDEAKKDISHIQEKKTKLLAA